MCDCDAQLPLERLASIVEALERTTIRLYRT